MKVILWQGYCIEGNFLRLAKPVQPVTPFTFHFGRTRDRRAMWRDGSSSIQDSGALFISKDIVCIEEDV
jgi:hypothetical protein